MNFSSCPPSQSPRFSSVEDGWKTTQKWPFKDCSHSKAQLQTESGLKRKPPWLGHFSLLLNSVSPLSSLSYESWLQKQQRQGLINHTRPRPLVGPFLTGDRTSRKMSRRFPTSGKSVISSLVFLSTHMDFLCNYKWPQGKKNVTDMPFLPTEGWLPPNPSEKDRISCSR